MYEIQGGKGSEAKSVFIWLFVLNAWLCPLRAAGHTSAVVSVSLSNPERKTRYAFSGTFGAYRQSWKFPRGSLKQNINRSHLTGLW